MICSAVFTQKAPLPCSTGINLESHPYKQQCELQQWISLARAAASVQHWAGTLNKQQNVVYRMRNPPGLKNTPLSLQFDKLQESFLSLEQQTSTFQAHLEGLGRGNQGGYAGPLTHAKAARSCSVSPQTSDVSLERHNSTSASTSTSSADADTDTPLSLCERSALQFSSTLGRLRRSGRRKWLLSDYWDFVKVLIHKREYFQMLIICWFPKKYLLLSVITIPCFTNELSFLNFKDCVAWEQLLNVKIFQTQGGTLSPIITSTNRCLTAPIPHNSIKPFV